MRYRVDGWTSAEGIVEGEAGLTFDEGLTDPNFSSAWNQISAQLKAEGAPSVRVFAARDQFVNEFSGLISGSFGLDASTAADKAKQFVTVGQTVLGAVDTVSGLVADMATETAPQIVNAFTGTLVGLAIAGGIVSAGIGSAIVGAIGIASDLLQQAGLFGPPPGIAVQGCPGITVSRPPDLVVGCVIGNTDAAVVTPGSPNWRRFPSSANGSDRAWYTVGGQIGQWRDVYFVNPNPYVRPIDEAFPNYAWVQRSATAQGRAPAIYPTQAGSPFQKAFASAWKANAEYALNGLKPQDDASVLLHTLRFWNRAHVAPSIALNQGGATYAESLVTRVVNQLSASHEIPITPSGGLSVNMGTERSVSRLVTMHATRAAGPIGLGTVAILGAAGLGAVALFKPALFHRWLGRVGVRV